MDAQQNESAPNAPAGQIQIDLMQVQMLLAFTTGIKPVLLSDDLSVNLSQITKYAPVEVLDAKDKPTGEIAPGIFMTDGQITILTKEQDEEFKAVWELFLRLSDNVLAFANVMFPPPPEQLATEIEQ